MRILRNPELELQHGEKTVSLTNKGNATFVNGEHW